MIRLAVNWCFALTMLLAAVSAEAAVYTVTKTADTNDGVCDSDCSLREAIGVANGTSENDVVVFALPFFSTPRVITLAGSEIVVANNGSLTIYGPGANRLTLNGNNASRILVSGANVVVNIHDLRFTGGNGVGATNTGRGGAVYNVGGTMVLTNSILTGNSAANGGAINNAASASPSVPATLTIVNCHISNNSSTSSGAAMQNFSTSTLHLRNSTVSNNTSSGTGIAGAFQANGNVTITNSTFSGNSASAGTGGGLYYNGVTLLVTNSTFAFNSSSVGGGGFHRTGTNPTAIFRNSIISNNTGATADPDAFGLVTSEGNNVIQNVAGSTGWVGSDQQGVDPRLSPLGTYGGIGPTHLLLTPSPAINQGQNCVVDLTCTTSNPPVAVTTDSRGALRPSGANVDAGAVEISGAYTFVLPSAQVGVAYNHVISSSIGSSTYTFGGGTLPPGINLTTNGGTAAATGQPTTSGSFKFFFNVETLPFTKESDVFAPSAVASLNSSINVLTDLTKVPVSGQVVSANGTPVRKAYVILAGLNGGTYTTLTNGFGYFTFADVSAGLTGTITVSTKLGGTFSPQTITVTDAIEGMELRANP